MATDVVDGRRRPNSLMMLVRYVLGQVFTGHLFVFFTRRRDRVRNVCWNAEGIAFSGADDTAFSKDLANPSTVHIVEAAEWF